MKHSAMKHQLESLKFMRKRKHVFDASDPGTGKTYVAIMDFVAQHKMDGKAMAVFCPKSLMRAAWANDIRKFAPHLKVALCYAENRRESLDSKADVYVINVDGVKDLARITSKTFWSKFGRLVIDESDAYKHHTSQRSRAMAKVRKHFDWVRLMSGTPAANGICDIWHQYYILDQGKRLGSSYFAFRAACCIPEQNGPGVQHIKWVDKPGIELVVGELVKDCTIRHKFEECIDIPENHRYAVSFALTAKHMKVYRQLEQNSLAECEGKQITAVHAAALVTKLLQTASGAVYNDSGEYVKVASERYELCLDLVEERQHSIVFYLWDHQLEELVCEASKRKLSYAIWDADHPEIEQEYQAGRYRVLFAHPQSAAHGLTLTRGTATIWPSPTINLTFFLQGLKRIHRYGQTQKTETIVLIAEGTRDELVWEAMQRKDMNLTALLTELEGKAEPCTAS